MKTTSVTAKDRNIRSSILVIITEQHLITISLNLLAAFFWLFPSGETQSTASLPHLTIPGNSKRHVLQFYSAKAPKMGYNYFSRSTLLFISTNTHQRTAPHLSGVLLLIFQVFSQWPIFQNDRSFRICEPIKSKIEISCWYMEIKRNAIHTPPLRLFYGANKLCEWCKRDRTDHWLLLQCFGNVN